MTTRQILIHMKYPDIISSFAKEANISLDEALVFFYNSELREKMENMVGDIHCRSRIYLADELLIEFQKTKKS